SPSVIRSRSSRPALIPRATHRSASTVFCRCAPIAFELTDFGVGRDWRARHLLHQLAQHRLGKAVATLGDQHEGGGAADDVAPVIFVEPRLLAEDRQTVDRDALADERVTSGDRRYPEIRHT